MAVKNDEQIETIVRILRILHSVSSASLAAVPVMFRPKEIQVQLDTIERLLEKLER